MQGSPGAGPCGSDTRLGRLSSPHLDQPATEPDARPHEVCQTPAKAKVTLQKCPKKPMCQPRGARTVSTVSQMLGSSGAQVSSRCGSASPCVRSPHSIRYPKCSHIETDYITLQVLGKIPKTQGMKKHSSYPKNIHYSHSKQKKVLRTRPVCTYIATHKIYTR